MRRTSPSAIRGNISSALETNRLAPRNKFCARLVTRAETSATAPQKENSVPLLDDRPAATPFQNAIPIPVNAPAPPQVAPACLRLLPRLETRGWPAPPDDTGCPAMGGWWDE